MQIEILLTCHEYVWYVNVTYLISAVPRTSGLAEPCKNILDYIHFQQSNIFLKVTPFRHALLFAEVHT